MSNAAPSDVVPGHTVERVFCFRARSALSVSLMLYTCINNCVAPAYAGWGKTLTRSGLPSLVKTVVAQELNDLQAGRTEHFRQPLQKIESLPAYQWTARPAMDYFDSGDRDEPPVRANVQRVARTRVAALPPAAAGSVTTSSITTTSVTTTSITTATMPQSAVALAFKNGLAGDLGYEQLVAAKVFVSDPLHGSIFKRKSPVKYIILHSTETASPADAHRVILSWNNRGLRHPGSQFVVDRDGTICSTVDPDLVTVHVDTNRTLPGYSNDNSIGIEIVRSGAQQYTQLQLDAVTRLVSYLQAHYGIADSDVTTHHNVQPSDRSDPVNFDFVAFESAKSELRNIASVVQRKVLTVLPKPAPDFRRVGN